MDIYNILKTELKKLIDENNLNTESIKISSKMLDPKEAIGETHRKDYPILAGKEIMVETKIDGGVGQAFTSSPSYFEGSLEDVMNLDLDDDYNKGLFIASLNAVMNSLGLCDRTIHCKDDEPEQCGREFLKYLKETHPNSNMLLVGYQPAILDNIQDEFNLRVLDLNEELLGTEQYGVLIEHGLKDYEDAVDWADVILCTGSTLANGSIVDYMNLEMPVYFYGTTIAGGAEILNLSRLCFCGR